MKLHPDDAAFLDAQIWVSTGRPCVVCRRASRPLAEVGHVEQNSGPGFAILLCRDDFAARLHFARCEAEDAGRAGEHRPSFPVLA
jgi:hypothetical protein